MNRTFFTRSFIAKTTFAAALLCVTALPAFSQEPAQRYTQESWWSLGFEFGNAFQSYTNEGSKYNDYYGSPGATFAAYGFVKNHLPGGFVKTSFLFPMILKGKEDGVASDGSRDDYDFIMQLDVMVGPAFKFSAGERVEFALGLGIHSGFVSGTENQNQRLLINGSYVDMKSVSATAYGVGLGADFNVKFRLGAGYFINLGCSGYWDFTGSVDGSGKATINGETFTVSTTKDLKRYNGFGVSPYLSIGRAMWAKVEQGYGRAPADPPPAAE